MNIVLLMDSTIEAMPEYGAVDVVDALASESHVLIPMSASALAGLRRQDADLLILPYLNGEIPEVALEALVRFHEAGGGLLVLGQLPHRDRWAPTRNFHAYRFHLTAYCGPGQVDGLSVRGREILGDVPAMEELAGRRFGCGRTTAFPPDETLPLFVSANAQLQWESTPGVWVERRGRRFLGARFAQIACMGGEPREKAAGGFPMPWVHDPGLLTRDWKGMDVLLRHLVGAMRPMLWAAALEIPPLHEAGSAVDRTLVLRNLTGGIQTTDLLRIVQGTQEETISPQVLQPHGLLEIPLAGIEAEPGLRQWELWDGERCLHRLEERVLPKRKQELSPLGFGFSTYWAFPSAEIPPEFLRFCQEMKARGCRYVRVNLPWEDLEPEPGVLDFRIPDAYVQLADELGLRLLFWMFPITRGATIGDGGVPAWVLQEPSMTHDGRAGFFPTLWSSYYQSHYFNLVDALSRRYADCPGLDRFVVDFGNSDFPYGYFYYVNDLTLFDYSPQEREAFARYLLNHEQMSLDEISALYGERMDAVEAIPVPRAERHPQAWRRYLDFRSWSIREGLQEIERIMRRNSPDKVAPDLPGHGAGSIADLSSYCLASKAAHWEEEAAIPRALTGLHNSGPSWGGEAWQVGARFQEYDDALFQSLRLGSDYFTIPGPDIGVYGEDIGKVGHIRSWVEGAKREKPELAILDSSGWNAFQSLVQVGARLDQPIDVLSARHRYDFSCYKLLVLPPDDVQGSMGTGGGGGQLLPRDREWAQQLRSSVEKGLQVLLYPDTARVEGEGVPHCYLRQELGLMDVTYGERVMGRVVFPESFGGDGKSGMLREVQGAGERMFCTEDGRGLLLRRVLGKGAIWLAGWDHGEDSLDGMLSPYETLSVETHSLSRLAGALGIHPPRIRSRQAYLYKEWLRSANGEFVLLFSHHREKRSIAMDIRLECPCAYMMDIATGERFEMGRVEQGWQHLELECQPCVGRYLVGVAAEPSFNLPVLLGPRQNSRERYR